MKTPRILIVRVGAMGDVLHALPAVAALRSALPAAQIGWAVDPRWAPLLRSASGESPVVDGLHLVDTRAWTIGRFLGEVGTLRRELLNAEYDLVLDLQGNLRSAVIARLAAASRVVGSATPREAPARFLYTQQVIFTQANVIDQAGEILSAAVGERITPIQATLPMDAEAEAWAAKFARTPFILIATTAGWGAKEWPLGNYASLIAQLQQRGYRVLVNATPTSSPDLRAEVVRSTLSQLIALTRRASLVIGGDTGPAHLAAALGRPTLALFGPTDPTRNGPAFPGSCTLTLRHPSSRTDHHRTPVTDAGLKQITVEEVLAAALTLLEPAPASRPGE